MKRMKKLATALLALTAMLFLAGNDQILCEPTPEEEVCAAPVDCEGLPHPACAGHWGCQSGECVWECKEKPPAPGCCNSDADCDAGSVCVGDMCEVAPAQGQCWSNDDCAFNQECTGQITCPCGALCFAASQPGKCQEVKSECQSDKDCGFGNKCTVEALCPPCVYADPPCKAACYAIGTCEEVKSECLQDAECPPGTVCQIESYCPPCVNENPPCMAPCWAAGECVVP